jgi:hypothetical protein
VNERVIVVCHACANAGEVPRPVSRREPCPSCGADLKCCLNCDFHDAASYNECRESAAERVVDKDRANHCDYFRPRAAGSRPAAAATAAKDTLEGLFGKN